MTSGLFLGEKAYVLVELFIFEPLLSKYECFLYERFRLTCGFLSSVPRLKTCYFGTNFVPYLV